MLRASYKVHSVLVVSASERTGGAIADMLPKARFSPVKRLNNAGEARRLFVNQPHDIVIINTPLPDEFGTELALHLAADGSCGVLLLVRDEVFDATADAVEEAGVLTLQKPNTAQAVYQAVRLLCAARGRISHLEKQNRTLSAKMEEVRIVNRAKWMLITRLNMDEAGAHRYLEKQAMDTRQTLRAVAQNIIMMYENGL